MQLRQLLQRRPSLRRRRAGEKNWPGEAEVEKARTVYIDSGQESGLARTIKLQ